MRSQVNTIGFIFIGLYPLLLLNSIKGIVFIRESRVSNYFMFGDGTVDEADTILS